MPVCECATIDAMIANVRALCVLRALALIGAASACNRQSAGENNNTQSNNSTQSNTQGSSAQPFAGLSCGDSAPSEGSSCEGHQIGHTCEWNSAIQCTCRQTPAGAQWGGCVLRSVPGPLPPPELAS